MADEPKSEIQEREFLNLKKEGLVEVVPMEKDTCEDAQDTQDVEVPESGEQPVPETSGHEVSDEQTTEKHVTKLRETERVRDEIKSETERMEFLELQNGDSTEEETVETLSVSIEKESGENVQDPQQTEAPESGKKEVLEISVCETSDRQETDTSEVEKAAETKDDNKIPEIRIEDFCDAPEVEGGSQGDERNIKQNLQEDQVFRDLCKERLAGYYYLILVSHVNQVSEICARSV